MFCCVANAMSSSVEFSSTFSIWSDLWLPPLPGATKTRWILGDLARRQASACSRPPPPSTRSFMVSDCACRYVVAVPRSIQTGRTAGAGDIGRYVMVGLIGLVEYRRGVDLLHVVVAFERIEDEIGRAAGRE